MAILLVAKEIKEKMVDYSTYLEVNIHKMI